MVTSLSADIKGENITIEKLEKDLGKDTIITEALWLKPKDMSSNFYNISLKGKDMLLFNNLLSYLLQIGPIEQLNATFKANKDCLGLLQSKGFNKYEKISYVDFKYEKENIKVTVMEDIDGYSIRVSALDNKQITNPEYALRLINRVFQIINEGVD